MSRHFRRDPNGVPAQITKRRNDHLDALHRIAASLEDDARMKGEQAGLQAAKKAVLAMCSELPDAEADVVRRVYQRLEELRRDHSAKIRERLANPIFTAA